MIMTKIEKQKTQINMSQNEFTNYKHCLEVTQLKITINQPEKNKVDVTSFREKSINNS